MFAGNVGAEDLAVLVLVNVDVAAAVAATGDLPKCRKQTGSEIVSPSQAVGVANLVVDAARAARSQYQVTGSVHLFMAVPAGLAMLIGQLLNTLGNVRT